MDNYLGQPAIYAHILNGTLVFTAVIFVFWNIAKLQNIDIYKKIVLMLLIGISIGVHGLSHFGVEGMYKYNTMPCGRNIGQMPCMRNIGQMPCGRNVGQMPCGRNVGQMPCGRNINQMPCAKQVRFAV